MKKIVISLTTLLVSFSTQSLLASGFHTPHSSAAYVGQGQTGITNLENASMVVYNPAAMVFLQEGTQAYGGFVRYDTDFNYDTLEGDNPASTTHDPSFAPHAYVAHNANTWAFGTGVYAPFNSGIEWPAGWEGQDELTRLNLKTLNQPLVFAQKLSDNLSVAGGINFIATSIVLEQVVEDETINAEVPATLGGTTTNTGANFAIYYRNANWSFGATHNTGYTINGNGKVEFDTSDDPALTDNFPDGDISVKFNIPSSSEAAVSYRSYTGGGDGYQRGAWAVELGAVHTTWSDYDEIIITYSEELPAEESTLTNNWFDVTDYKIGGFYSFREDMKVRFGYYVTTSAIPEETLGPITPDGEGRNSYYAGYGYKRGSLLLDFAYIYGIFKDSKTETNEELTGEYTDGIANVFTASVGYRFE